MRYLGGGIGHLQQFLPSNESDEEALINDQGNAEAEIDDFIMADNTGSDNDNEGGEDLGEDDDDKSEDDEGEDEETENEDSDEENGSDPGELSDKDTGNVY